MPKKYLIVGVSLVIFLAVVVFGILIFKRFDSGPIAQTTQQNPTPTERPVSPTETPLQVPETYQIQSGNYVGQTFNNCGPASLSMVMSMLGTNVSQAELALVMRPFNNPQGGVDDKSIFAQEFVLEAQRQGFSSLHRPNGTVDLVKKLVASDIPVVVRTWLNDHEDIGHFRIVRGYDDTRGVFIQDDSYQGPNLQFSYDEFNDLWQPFNYGYILVYPKEKQEIVEKILGEEIDEKIAWQNALKRGKEEVASGDPNTSIYSSYNILVANYYLGNYKDSVWLYETISSRLPSRMLWYQPEPIYAYQKTEQYDKAIELIDRILFHGNLAYSELYQVKGEIYLVQGNKDAARAEFEKAVYYNSSFQPAKEALKNL